MYLDMLDICALPVNSYMNFLVYLVLNRQCIMCPIQATLSRENVHKRKCLLAFAFVCYKQGEFRQFRKPCKTAS